MGNRGCENTSGVDRVGNSMSNWCMVDNRGMVNNWGSMVNNRGSMVDNRGSVVNSMVNNRGMVDNRGSMVNSMVNNRGMIGGSSMNNRCSMDNRGVIGRSSMNNRGSMDNRGMISRSSMDSRSVRIAGYSFIGDILNVSRVSISTIVDHLSPAIRKSHPVCTRVGVSISLLLLSKVSSTVVITDFILVSIQS